MANVANHFVVILAMLTTASAATMELAEYTDKKCTEKKEPDRKHTIVWPDNKGMQCSDVTLSQSSGFMQLDGTVKAIMTCERKKVKKGTSADLTVEVYLMAEDGAAVSKWYDGAPASCVPGDEVVKGYSLKTATSSGSSAIKLLSGMCVKLEGWDQGARSEYSTPDIEYIAWDGYWKLTGGEDMPDTEDCMPNITQSDDDGAVTQNATVDFALPNQSVSMFAMAAALVALLI